MESTAALAAFSAAAAGLLMPSEQDHPFTPVALGHIPAEPAALCAALGLPAETPAEVRSFAALFDRLTSPRPWHTAADIARLVEFAGLRDTLANHLAGPVVVRLGAVTVTLLIVGHLADGTLAGVQTTVVET